LLELCRYIVRNPVAAGIVKEAGEWPWSSYQMTAGIAPKDDFTTTAWVLDQFGSSVQRFVEYVAMAPETDAPLESAKGSHVLGGEAFLMQAQRHVGDSCEAPRIERQLVRRKLEDLDSGRDSRGEWMSDAYRQHGYTMREIADYANVHYSLVSKIIKTWEKR